jgi:hypothetical protein
MYCRLLCAKLCVVCDRIYESPEPSVWRNNILFAEISKDSPTPLVVTHMLRALAAAGALSQVRGVRFGRAFGDPLPLGYNRAAVVAGHKKPGAPDSPSAIQETKRYLQDFERLQKTATSDQELFDQMTELYPHWVANQSWLMFGFRSHNTRIRG